MRTNTKQKTLRLVELAMLIALIFIMQYIGTIASAPLIKAFGIELSFVLIPIVIGAFLMGPIEGAILGLTFGIMTVVMTVTVPGTMTYILFWERPIVFTILALTKAVGAGLGSALIYKGLGKAFKGKAIYAQTVLASASAPMINTGIFVLGMVFFKEIVAEKWSGGANIFLFIIGLIWINFLIELAINIILSPAIVRIISIVGNNAKRKLMNNVKVPEATTHVTTNVEEADKEEAEAEEAEAEEAEAEEAEAEEAEAEEAEAEEAEAEEAEEDTAEENNAE